MVAGDNRLRVSLMLQVWKSVGVQTRFIAFAAIGVLAIVAAAVALVGWAEDSR